MRLPRTRTSLLLTAALAGPACVPAGAAPEDGVYERKRPSRDGTGKTYMGREISLVMGHQGIGWLERAGREREERTDLLVANMELAADAVVADIGAGSGYFTFRIAPRVPGGRVLAVDIQPEMLEVIEKRRLAGGVANVETILGSEANPRLPSGVVDAVLMVDAYHEFSYPREMMTSLFQALAPGGRVYLVEYRAEDPSVPIKPLHKMSEEQARRELEAVGLRFVENRPVLPQQHFLIFEKPERWR